MRQPPSEPWTYGRYDYMANVVPPSGRSILQELLSRFYDSVGEAGSDVCRLLRAELGVDVVYASRVVGEELEILAVDGGLDLGIAAGTRLPLAETFCARALQGDAPRAVSDLGVGPYADLECRQTLGVTSYAMTPLRSASGEATGTLSLLSREPRDFTEDELALVELLAGILAREQQLDGARSGEAARAAELEGANDRYRSLVDDLGDLIVEVDALGHITYVNPAVTALTGLSNTDLAGAELMDHVHPDDHELASAHLMELLTAAGTDTEVAPREVRFIALDGSLRWMTVRGRAVFNEGGEFAGFLGILHDVTVRMEAEQQVRTALAQAEVARDEAEAARDEAQRASRAKSEFLSRMSHELRTPLNAILGFAQLLQLGELVGEDEENVEQILSAGRHLLDLINEVLDVVSIEAGKLSLSLEAVAVAEVVAESLDLVRPAAAARDITLRAPALESGWVRADRQRLKQVLVNLLSNAVKYNVHGGQVVVTCTKTPAPQATDGAQGTDEGSGWVRLAVQDTGRGIPADRLADAFTPFDRLGAEATDIEGTGVGLSLTKTLVEAQGGRLGVVSSVGEGSTFWVELPAGAAVTIEDSPATPEVELVRTVLYVEDNTANVTLMRRILARRPHVRLVVVSDGVEAVEVAQQLLPDLILLDLHLPGLPGAGILTAVRGSHEPRLSKVPVVIVTADLTTGTERRMLEAGATLFLPKPIDVRTLLAVVDEHLPLP